MFVGNYKHLIGSSHSTLFNKIVWNLAMWCGRGFFWVGVGVLVFFLPQKTVLEEGNSYFHLQIKLFMYTVKFAQVKTMLMTQSHFNFISSNSQQVLWIQMKLWFDPEAVCLFSFSCCGVTGFPAVGSLLLILFKILKWTFTKWIIRDGEMKYNWDLLQVFWAQLPGISFIW